MLTINNKSDIAEIYLSGEIVDDTDGGAIAYWRDGDSSGYEFPAKLKSQLDEVSDKELEIHINSCGGSVFAGIAMANFIKNHKAPTTCIVDGVAASIASQIFFSADVCKIPANCYLMLHKPFTSILGNADDLRKAADTLDKIQQGLESTYLSKMQDGMSVDDLKQMMNDETWLTGTEAAQKFKVELLEPVKVLNCVENKEILKAMGISHIPPSLNFLDKSTLQKEDEDKIRIALSRAKGVLLE